MDRFNVVLWILQLVLGVYFVFVGVMHFVLPEGLPEVMGWMYELTDTQHTLSGIAEILGGLGLILPGLTRIMPGLTVWAALGLIGVMVGAMVWHFGRDELTNIGTNVLLIVLLAVVAYGRWRARPLPSREAAAT